MRDFGQNSLIWLRDANRDLVARHYLHLGERQRKTHFGDGAAVPQKKLFYALRPAAALRWLRLHPGEAVPPMHFPTLMDQCAPSQEVRDVIAELLERKASTRELGSSLLPASIADFLDNEFAQARALRLAQAGFKCLRQPNAKQKRFSGMSSSGSRRRTSMHECRQGRPATLQPGLPPRGSSVPGGVRNRPRTAASNSRT
jgi:hypothetical protein